MNNEKSRTSREARNSVMMIVVMRLQRAMSQYIYILYRITDLVLE